jgi:hypothetical protein
MIQYGVATTQTVYMGYSGLAITAKVAKGGVLAAIAGSVTDNSDGSYIVPLAATETQSPVVTLVVSAPGVSAVALYLVTESNYTAALATALGTTNTTVAGWLTSGIALTAGALSTISGYVSALSIPSATTIAAAVWATIASGSTSILTVLAGLYGWTVGQVTGYAGGQAPPTAASIASAVAAPSAATIASAVAAPSAATIASAVAAPSAATIATAVWATIASGTTSALAAIGSMFSLLPASKMAAQSDITSLNNLSSAQVTTAAQTALTNQGLSTSLVTALGTTNTTIAGFLSSGITLTAGTLTSIAGSVWNALTATYNIVSTFGAFVQAITGGGGGGGGSVTDTTVTADVVTALGTYGAAKTTDVSDATGTITTAISGIWNAAISGFTTVGSIGKALLTLLRGR